VRVNAADGALLTLAGAASYPGFADGVGSSARFSGALGIALNTDESALVIVDLNNRRIRKLLLANNSVTTVAGSGASGGLVDGPALTATFSSAYGAKWHCNAAERTCGVLVADNGNGARFVALETDATAATSGTFFADIGVVRSDRRRDWRQQRRMLPPRVPTATAGRYTSCTDQHSRHLTLTSLTLCLRTTPPLLDMQALP
jgi:hypothetical protein